MGTIERQPGYRVRRILSAFCVVPPADISFVGDQAAEETPPALPSVGWYSGIHWHRYMEPVEKVRDQRILGAEKPSADQHPGELSSLWGALRLYLRGSMTLMMS